MPRNLETAEEYFVQSSIPSVRSYFGRVVKGQPEVYDTPFAKGETTEELLGAWNDVLKSIDNRWPSLYEFEMDLAKKVGPLSVMKPLSERLPDIEAYYEGILLPSKPISDRALSAVLAEWRNFRGLRLRDQRRTLEIMKKSTNSGNPYFTKRRNVVDDTYPCTTRLYKNGVWQSLAINDESFTTSWKSCALLGWRGQEGGYSKEDVKQRVVWMFPFAVNINELQFYQPAIEVAQVGNIVPAWVSMDAVDAEVTRLFDTKSDSDLIVCTDFSKFDQHFNPHMQQFARETISNLLTRNRESSLWVQEIFGVKYMIPLMYDFGVVKAGPHGMGSGSGGTNFDETLSHRGLQYEAAMLHGARLNPSSMCLGDDGILSYPGITVNDVVKAYSAHGQEMNAEKQYASTQDCIFLRRWHHKDYRDKGICVGVYSTMRALGRMRYLERYQDPEYWGPEAVALRQLSILENVKFHPLREQFVEFCMKRDRYRLGIDIPGFLSNIRTLALEYIDHMPDFLGYTKTMQSDQPARGISEWWIVKYLKSLS